MKTLFLVAIYDKRTGNHDARVYEGGLPQVSVKCLKENFAWAFLEDFLDEDRKTWLISPAFYSEHNHCNDYLTFSSIAYEISIVVKMIVIKEESNV